MKVVKFKNVTVGATKRDDGWYYWVKKDLDPIELKDMQKHGPFKSETEALNAGVKQV